MTLMTYATWGICAATTAAVIIRPFRWSEARWAVAGAALLLISGLMPIRAAIGAVGEGLDVYLFLIGMMLLSEVARKEGLFEWVAATAAIHSKGSSARLFALIYAAGIVTTIFLSNDATAVVLTPAVYAAAKKSKAVPLPLLFACAQVANAASFVLPISNPANLVLYGNKMPALTEWFSSFALPSFAAIVVTFLSLRWIHRRALAEACEWDVSRSPLTRGGKVAMTGIIATAILLIVTSASDGPLGLPTAIAGIATTVMVCTLAQQSIMDFVRDVSWSVLPLVAGLFVLVEALDRTGVIADLAQAFRTASVHPACAAALSGTTLAAASNLLNNLPAGLIASTAVAQAQPPRLVIDALLIGVDLGPNLSITGSLATILWLQAIRREGQDIGFWSFFKVGVIAMPLALGAALGTRIMLR